MKKIILTIASIVIASSTTVMAKDNHKGKDKHKTNHHKKSSCPVSYAELTAKLKEAVKPTSSNPDLTNGGLDFHMWATVVTRDGTVCAVTKTGDSINAQWLGSRVISAQKANTAVAFSTDSYGAAGTANGAYALSTANLWEPTQPGGSLFGLQHSNPVDTSVAYRGHSKHYGQHNDPMLGKKIGGVNVFGGGLALYSLEGELVGAIGVSGDTSCADHNVAWRLRDALVLDNTPNYDGIIYDIDGDGATSSGFGHPTCGGLEATIADEIGATLP